MNRILAPALVSALLLSGCSGTSAEDWPSRYDDDFVSAFMHQIDGIGRAELDLCAARQHPPPESACVSFGYSIINHAPEPTFLEPVQDQEFTMDGEPVSVVEWFVCAEGDLYGSAEGGCNREGKIPGMEQGGRVAVIAYFWLRGEPRDLVGSVSFSYHNSELMRELKAGVVEMSTSSACRNFWDERTECDGYRY